MIQTKTGKWLLEESGELLGVVPAGLRAACINGKETDAEYVVRATLRVVKGDSASIMVFFTVSGTDDRFIEFILDITNNKLKLDRVDGVSRVNITEVSYTLAKNADYECEVVAKTDSSGKGYVECSIQGAVVIKETDLLTIYVAGKHGYACEGASGDSAQFTKRFIQKQEYYADLSTILTELQAIKHTELVGRTGTMQQYYDKLENYVIEASRFIDRKTERQPNFFQDKGVEITEYTDGVGSSPPSGTFEFEESVETWREVAATIFTKQRPIVSITSIDKNTAAIGETDSWVAITAFRYYLHGEIIFSPSAIPPKGNKNVRIIYRAGFDETPQPISMACTRLIINLILKQIGEKTETFTSFKTPTSISFAAPDVYTDAIKTVLDSYKMLGFGEM